MLPRKHSAIDRAKRSAVSAYGRKWQAPPSDRMAFGRLQQGPALRIIIPGKADPAAGSFKPLHGLQPGIEQKVAPPERANR